MTSVERRGFLEREQITHVLLGSEERRLADRERARVAPPLHLEPFLETVYQDGETRLFRVR
jgi:hypothetical protein